MIGVNLQTSFLTPPVGFALFYLRGVAPPSVTTGHIYRGIVPFVALQLIAIGMLWAFPQLATWLPGVVFGKPTAAITRDGTDAAPSVLDSLLQRGPPMPSATSPLADLLKPLPAPGSGAGPTKRWAERRVGKGDGET